MNAVLGFTVLALTVVVWLYIERRRVSREIEHAFRGRVPLTDDEFFAAYYRDSGISRDTVIGVRQVLGSELQIDVSRVIPTDDFSGNLHFLLDSDSMLDVEIVGALETRFGIKISDREAESTKSIHDIISFVHGKTLATT